MVHAAPDPTCHAGRNRRQARRHVEVRRNLHAAKLATCTSSKRARVITGTGGNGARSRYGLVATAWPDVHSTVRANVVKSVGKKLPASRVRAKRRRRMPDLH